MAPTLKIISERVGISQAAVSMILNRSSKDLSSQATREKVFAIAEELNYKQKFGHKILRGDKTRSVVIIISIRWLIMQESIQNLVLLLLDHFEKSAYTPSLVTIPGNDEGNLQMTRELIQRGTDHFVVIGCPSNFTEMEAEIKKSGRTVIGFNSLFKRNLNNDMPYEVRMTIRKFTDAGHHNFRIITKNNYSNQKINAVTEIFPELSREEVISKYIYSANFSEDVENIDQFAKYGYDATKNILENDPKVSALMYISDYHMIGGMRYLYKRGLHIGKDIILCGVGNIHSVRNSIFPLWSWQLDITQIAELLFKNCSGTEPFSQLVKPIFKEIN
jgi:LacI family transcriptional regulator